MYLGILTTSSTAGLYSRPNSDIYTPSCTGAPSYLVWTLEGDIKQQQLSQISAVISHDTLHRKKLCSAMCVCGYETLTSTCTSLLKQLCGEQHQSVVGEGVRKPALTDATWNHAKNTLSKKVFIKHELKMCTLEDTGRARGRGRFRHLFTR